MYNLCTSKGMYDILCRRDMKLPWSILREVLERITNIASKDDYIQMTRDGDTILDIVPGGVLQRTPVPFEMFAESRRAQANETGETQAHVAIWHAMVTCPQDRTKAHVLIPFVLPSCPGHSPPRFFFGPCQSPRQVGTVSAAPPLHLLTVHCEVRVVE